MFIPSPRLHIIMFYTYSIDMGGETPRGSVMPCGLATSVASGRITIIAKGKRRLFPARSEVDTTDGIGHTSLCPRI